MEIYAERMSISPTDLHENLNDVEWMNANLYAKVPVRMIKSILESTVDRSLAAVGDYLII